MIQATEFDIDTEKGNFRFDTDYAFDAGVGLNPHFGELHGGQMIKKRAPGSGKMYDFVEPRALIKETRTRLHDGMADEANRAFEFAMQLFKELEE